MATYRVNRRAIAHAKKLIAAGHYRAAEYRHKEVELAAHRLLQVLDKKAFGS